MVDQPVAAKLREDRIGTRNREFDHSLPQGSWHGRKHLGQGRMKYPRVAVGLRDEVAKQLFQHFRVRRGGVRRGMIGHFAELQGNRRVQPVLRP